MNLNERLDRRRFVGGLALAGAAAAGFLGTAAIGTGIGIGVSEGGETDQSTGSDSAPAEVTRSEAITVPGAILGGVVVDMAALLLAAKGVTMILGDNQETSGETVVTPPTVVFRNQQQTT